MPRAATVQDLAQALASTHPPLLIDVRSPAEHAAVRLEAARLVPLDTLAGAAGSLPRDREVWCLCRSGARSGRAAAMLEQQGFSTVNVAGGLLAWQGAGLPVTRSQRSEVTRFPVLPLLAALTLGLAPFLPEPHLIGKLRWVAGGAVGMTPLDWGDLALHAAPWVWLGVAAGLWLRRR